MSKTLIIAAHGSRRDSANIAVIELAAKLALPAYKSIKVGFLELASPSIQETIEAVASCTHQIDVYPLFLSPGKHLEDDIPKLVSDMRHEYPKIAIRLLSSLGRAEHLADFIAAQINSETNS